MIDINADKLASWKESFAKMGIVYKTDDEYYEAARNLVGYFETLMEMDIEQKLKKEDIDY